MLGTVAKAKIILSRKRKQLAEENGMLVTVRIRPISDAEISQGSKEIVNVVEENMVCMLDPYSELDILRANRSREKTFVFDHAFGPFTTQQQLYNQTTKTLVLSVLEGYNATIFAYGPTGAGKTYTMLGTDVEPGIMVLTLDYLYQEMHRTRHDQTYQVKMSYLEIYNEMVRDLLNPSSDYLDLREDSNGVQVAGLTEYEALTTEEIMELLSRGNKERMCEPTAVNKTSSRSHAILQITVEQRSRVRDISDEVKTAKLFMIDLAGSERAAQTQNTGKRLIEGAHINRSLLALGNCINALSENKAGSYVNYRDSKLTRLLKDSLGGNCKTVMIAHVSPASLSFEETRNTLTYADRAKSIKLKAKKNQYNVNYHVAQYQNIISDLRQEIIRLKTQLVDADTSMKSTSARSFTVRSKSANVMDKLKEEMTLGFNEQLEIRKELIELEDTALQLAVDYQKNQLVIDEWEQELSKLRSRDNNKGKRKYMTMTDTIRAFKITRNDTFRIVKDAEKLLMHQPEMPVEVVKAKKELNSINQELISIENQKRELNEKLEECKKESEYLSESFQTKISNDEKRELLVSLCKIHEFQIKNVELEAIALMRDYMVQQKEIAIQRNLMRHDLVAEIIETQRNLIQDNNVTYPENLASLYTMYKDYLTQDQIAISTLAIEAKGLTGKAGTTTLPSLTTTETTPRREKTPRLQREDILNHNNTNNRKQKTNKKKTHSRNNSINQLGLESTNNSDDQESVASFNSKFTLTKNPFPSTVYERDQSADVSRRTTPRRSANSSPRPPLNEQSLTKPNHRKDIRVDVPQKQNASNRRSLTEQRLLNNSLLLQRVNNKLIHVQDTDNESTISLQTLGVKMKSKNGEEYNERKRSASAGMIRERQRAKLKTQKKSYPKAERANKDKERGKPTWNNNFNGHKAGKTFTKQDLNNLSITQPTFNKQKHYAFEKTSDSHRLKSHMEMPVQQPYRQHTTTRSRPSPRVEDYGMMKFGRAGNDPLAISGTTFNPKPKQPGFARM